MVDRFEHRRAIVPEPRFELPELLTFGVVYLVLLMWMPSFMERLYPLTGDEPFYVMTAISLVQDGDLDERNNYLERDFDTFYPVVGPTIHGWPSYPDPLPPHATASDLPGLYSKHGLGTALLIALPWEIGGRTLTLIILAVIAATLAANMSLLARQFYTSAVVAVAVALSLALTNPLLSFSLLIFPEMTAALCILYTVRRALSRRNTPWQWLLMGICAGALPWLHYRLVPVSVVLALIVIVRFRRMNSPRVWLVAATPPTVSAIVLFVWYRHLYGSPLPPSSDHAGFSDLVGTLNGLAGTFLDQQWGAFVHNPLLLLAAASAVPFAIRFRTGGLIFVAVILPYLVLISAYRVWWGEWNPPARYLTDIVPLAAAPLGWWLSNIGSRLRITLLAVAGLPAFGIMATFVADPQRMYNQPDGTSRLLETWSDWFKGDLTELVPSYVFYSASTAFERLHFTGLGIAAVFAIVLLAVALVDGTDHAK